MRRPCRYQPSSCRSQAGTPPPGPHLTVGFHVHQRQLLQHGRVGLPLIGDQRELVVLHPCQHGHRRRRVYRPGNGRRPDRPRPGGHPDGTGARGAAYRRSRTGCPSPRRAGRHGVEVLAGTTVQAISRSSSGEGGRLHVQASTAQELLPLPRRAGAPWCGADPGAMQDLPHRGGGDRVAELDEFALHAPVPPARIVGCHADHELADRGCSGRPRDSAASRNHTYVRSAAGARRAALPGSLRRPHPHRHRGPAGTVPRATAGHPAGSAPGRSGGARPRSRAAASGVRHPWTPHPGPAPSGSSADSAQAGRRPRRSLRDDPSLPGCPGQIQ
jgi:hypothetical protein